MKPFDNSSIRQRVADKPHICKVGGRWRVSKAPKNLKGAGLINYTTCHIFITRLGYKAVLK